MKKVTGPHLKATIKDIKSLKTLTKKAQAAIIAAAEQGKSEEEYFVMLWRIDPDGFGQYNRTEMQSLRPKDWTKLLFKIDWNLVSKEDRKILQKYHKATEKLFKASEDAGWMDILKPKK